MTRHPARLAAFVTLVISLGLAASAAPAAVPDAGAPATQPPDAAAVELHAQLLKAYRNAPGYRATVVFEYLQDRGRMKVLQTMDYKIAFDRAGSRLKIDQVELYIVCDAGKLKLKAAQIKDRYLETDAPPLTDYATVRAALPGLTPPHLPDLALLLNDDVGPDKPDYLAPEAGDPDHAPGLQFKTEQGAVTVRVDPRTHLLRSVVIDSPPTPPGAAGIPDQPAVWNTRSTWRFDGKITAGPLDAKQFTFDAPANAKPFANLRGMVTGEVVADEPEHNGMEGQAPPQLALKTLEDKAFNSADEKARVLIFDFWTTWCPHCPEGLDHLQTLSDWAKKQNLSVAIYTIDGGDTAESVKKFTAEHKPQLSLPILMDPEGNAQRLYSIEGFPTTVVIFDGKIHRVVLGAVPGLDETLKREITQFLSPPAATQKGQ